MPPVNLQIPPGIDANGTQYETGTANRWWRGNLGMAARAVDKNSIKTIIILMTFLLVYHEYRPILSGKPLTGKEVQRHKRRIIPSVM